MTPPSLLITGASGFIGSFMVEAALSAGFTVWAAVRDGSSRSYLQDPRIRFFHLDLRSDEALQAALREQVAAHGPWDYVIHAAGATKCRTEADFFRTNTEGTLRLARLLVAEQALRHRFVFVSSLSVMGALREQPVDAPAEGLHYAPILDTDTPGPRERDYFLMAKSIARHVDFAVGYRPQEITFIYVRDLVQAALAALTRGTRGRAYFLTDGCVYTSRAFSDLLQREMGVRRVLHITAPLWFLRVVSRVAGTVAG